MVILRQGALSKTFLKGKSTSATWTSSDRGIGVTDGERGGNSQIVVR